MELAYIGIRISSRYTSSKMYSEEMTTPAVRRAWTSHKAYRPAKAGDATSSRARAIVVKMILRQSITCQWTV